MVLGARHYKKFYCFTMRWQQISAVKKNINLMVPFYWQVQLPQGYSHFEAVYFLPLSSQKFLLLFYQPRKDKKLSRPLSHSVVLNTGLVDLKSCNCCQLLFLLRDRSFSDVFLSCFLFWFHESTALPIYWIHPICMSYWRIF